MRKDSLIPSLLGIPPIQISRELLEFCKHDIPRAHTKISTRSVLRVKPLASLDGITWPALQQSAMSLPIEQRLIA